MLPTTQDLPCSPCAHAGMELPSSELEQMEFFPPCLSFGDEVNGFLKGRADRAAELAGFVPSSWFLVRGWAWLGMAGEEQLFQGRMEQLIPQITGSGARRHQGTMQILLFVYLLKWHLSLGPSQFMLQLINST